MQTRVGSKLKLNLILHKCILKLQHYNQWSAFQNSEFTGKHKKKTLKLNWWWTKLEQQVRELEQQLNKSTQQRQSSVLSGEEEFLGMGVLQKTPPQERNVNYIRTIEKEKRVALEVCIATTTEACRPTISCLAKVCVCVFLFFLPMPATY